MGDMTTRLSAAATASVLGGAIAIAVVLAPQIAGAALTSSEKGQIGSYVAEGRPATAARVRALVARPDLTIDESAAVLEDAVRPLAWSDGRAAYFHELLVGPSSLPSRGVVAVAVTRALVARADAVLGRHEADLDQDPAVIAELARIYAFVDSDVANAGAPRGNAHDPGAGIGDSAYDDAGRALTAHMERHARWLKGDATIPAAAAPVRGQLQLAIFDMAGDVPTRRIDAADHLGLTTGPRRASLVEMGVLLLDDGHTEAARLEAVRGLLARLPGARGEVEAVALAELRPAVRGRGAVIAAQVSADAASSPFGDEVAGPALDGTTAALARELAAVAVRRALDIRAELKTQAQKDAGGDPQAALAAEVQRLVLDAPSAIDLAMVRGLGGKPAAVALLSDAVGALAAFAAPAAGGLAVPLAGAGAGGVIATTPATGVRLAPAGFATSFAFGGHTWAFARDDDGKTTAKRDGAPVTLAMLDRARAPVAAGSVWSADGLVFAKMCGAPRAGVSAGGRVRMLAAKSDRLDAIGTAAPGDDVAVDAQVTPQGEAVIAVRAIGTRDGFKGAALVLDATGPTLRASLRAWDDAGKATELAPPVDIAPAAKLVVHVVVKGGKLEAKVGGQTLRADVPPALVHGDVALASRRGGGLEVTGFVVKRP